MQSNIRNFSIIAHVDHGKSTLADRFLELTGSVDKRKIRAQMLDTMDLERERGITIKLQPATMTYKARINADTEDALYKLNLIDTPGHVDFAYEVSRSLAAVEGVLLVVDATQGVQAQTLANLHMAQELKLAVVPVINKIDLPAADVESAARELAELGVDFACPPIEVSAKKGTNVQELLNAIVRYIPPPQGKSESSLRALIFDSFYDPYRGVIAYIKVVDGALESGAPGWLIQAGKEFEALEVGHICLGLERQKTLNTGQIGYIVTSLKDIGSVRVGDTVTAPAAKNSTTPLAGYRESVPMVYAGLYTATGAGYEALRDALAKLKLNDASLSYTPESSTAFGFGFKAGFLGLLHLEIVKERLEREYGLELIVTTPTVAYRQQVTSGKLQVTSKSSNHQTPTTNPNWEEPWSKVEIILPESFLGSVMQLVTTRRGTLGDVKYLGDRVVLEAELPLGEIIVDFYDKLKAITSGYGSVSYKLTGYRPVDLVQLDVLVAGDKAEALSRLVPKVKVNRVARRLVEELKEVVPRQNFEVRLQAVVGGDVIAAERISPYRKDVTEKLYGGDVTRKRKLLEKQKKGKRKMAQIGKVEVPTEVFIKLLKH